MYTSTETGRSPGRIRERNLPVAHPALPSENIPARLLPQTLSVRDLTILCLFAVLLITNIQEMASGGAVSFLYWFLGFLTFLIPSALVSAQLYRLFPGEGAVYLWANKAFGNFWDTFLGFFCNWWPGAIGLTVEAGAVVTSIQSLNGQWLTAPWQQGCVEIVVLLAAQGLCFLGQRALQRILNVVFCAYVSLFVLIGFVGIIWIAGGHLVQADFSAPAWQIQPMNFSLFPIVTLALLGMAVPLNLGAEVVNARRAHTYVYWGMAATMLGYLIATWGILVVLPTKDLASPVFLALVFEQAFGAAIGSALGTLAYLILVAYFVCATAAYNTMFSRLLLVAGIDHRLPGAMRKLNSQKVPFNAMFVQTGMNIIFIFLIFFITAETAGQELSTTVFLIVINGAAVVWNIAMIGLFLCGILLCSRYRTQLAGRWIVPSYVLYPCIGLGIIATCISIYGTFFSGSPVPLVSNQDWVFWVLLTVFISLTIGGIYSFLVPEAEDLLELLQRSGESSARKIPAPSVASSAGQVAQQRSGLVEQQTR
jgi:amino acid transporter